MAPNVSSQDNFSVLNKEDQSSFTDMEFSNCQKIKVKNSCQRILQQKPIQTNVATSFLETVGTKVSNHDSSPIFVVVHEMK